MYSVVPNVTTCCNVLQKMSAQQKIGEIFKVNLLGWESDTRHSQII